MAPLGSPLFEIEFRKKYAELVSGGLAPNLAAAQALTHAAAFELSSGATPMDDDTAAKKRKSPDKLTEKLAAEAVATEPHPMNAMVDDKCSSEPVPSLASELAAARSTAESTGDWALVERVVRGSFAGATALVRRHLLPPVKVGVLGRALDPEALAATYAELGRCTDAREAVFDAYAAAVSVGLPEDVLGFLALLYNPALTERVTPVAQELLGRLCAYAAALPVRGRRLLVNWFASGECPPALFGDWLKGLQQFITISVYQAERTDSRADIKGVNDAIKVMALMYAGNTAAESEGCGKVSHKDFYNDAVNESLFDVRANTAFVRQAYREWQDDCRHTAAHKATASKASSGGAPKVSAGSSSSSLSSSSPGGGAEDRGASAQDDEWVPSSFLSYPFVLSPATKAKVLQIDATQQMNRGVQSEMMSMLTSGRQLVPYLILRVRRSHIVEDAMRILAACPQGDLKKPLKVVFQGEEGIDEGGPAKEFMQVVTRHLLDPQFTMFKAYDESRLLYFNGSTFEIGLEFELIGTLVGVAIFNSIILDVPFPVVVYKRLKGARPVLADLAELDPSLARSLGKMLSFEGDVETAFGAAFQISVEAWGGMQTIDLVEGGGDKPVTSANVKDYVDAYVQYLLVDAVKGPFEAFRKGFMRVCGGQALDLFRAEELELLVCGNPVLDFEALQRCTHYEDGFEEDSTAMVHFWQVVHAFSEGEKRLLLKFFSGSDRAPIEGLSKMTFVISRQGPDSEQLPTAHTCFNHLLVPDYASRAKMEAKLRCAIHQSEGFGLR